jgi:hypothetical protein
MVLRGNTWHTVGDGGFSPGDTAHVSLETGADGTVAVAFQDRANGYATTVMEIHQEASAPAPYHQSSKRVSSLLSTSKTQ